MRYLRPDPRRTTRTQCHLYRCQQGRLPGELFHSTAVKAFIYRQGARASAPTSNQVRCSRLRSAGRQSAGQGRSRKGTRRAANAAPESDLGTRRHAETMATRRALDTMHVGRSRQSMKRADVGGRV